MTPSNQVTLSLSDEDFRDLVAEALESEILKSYGYDILVTDVSWEQNWEITYSMEEKKE